jgi:glycosyltransferase involved in cell wall biosynthesis
MKIVWFSHDAALAGAELSMLEAVSGLGAKGERIHAVLPARSELTDRLEHYGATVTVLPYRWWIGIGPGRALSSRARRLLRNLQAWPLACRLLRQEQPDLVISNTLAIGIGALAARTVGVPHLWYIHEMHGPEGHDLYFDLGERASLSLMDRLSTRVLVNSHAVRRQLVRSIPAEKIRVVYYGVATAVDSYQLTVDSNKADPSSLSTVHCPPSTAFRITIVGRISLGKRQEDAVRAVALLARKGLDVRLSLIGTEAPDYGPSLRALVRELGVENRVEFVAFTDDPFSLVAAADLSVICSRGEAFGRVTIEAMKLGKPVVGADSGGTSELIRDGWSGLLYRLGDAEDLAGKIEKLYYDRALLATMGANARSWARETFSLERYTRELQAVFHEVLTARCARGARCPVPSAVPGARCPVPGPTEKAAHGKAACRRPPPGTGHPAPGTGRREHSEL